MSKTKVSRFDGVYAGHGSVDVEGLPVLKKATRASHMRAAIRCASGVLPVAFSFRVMLSNPDSAYPEVIADPSPAASPPRAAREATSRSARI